MYGGRVRNRSDPILMLYYWYIQIGSKMGLEKSIDESIMNSNEDRKPNENECPDMSRTIDIGVGQESRDWEAVLEDEVRGKKGKVDRKRDHRGDEVQHETLNKSTVWRLSKRLWIEP